MVIYALFVVKYIAYGISKILKYYTTEQKLIITEAGY
jgi:hypothetical protein